MSSPIGLAQTAFDPASQGWKPFRGSSRAPDQPDFNALIGPFWAKRQESGWLYAFQAETRHLNPQGVVHGGMLMSFIDYTLSMLAWEAAGRRPCVTAGLNNHFVGPARAGDWIEAQGRVVRGARSLVFMQGSLSVNGNAILTADGIWKILGED